MCRINIKILATEDIFFFLLSNVDLKYQLEEVIQNFAFFSPAEVYVWEKPFHNRSFFLRSKQISQCSLFLIKKFDGLLVSRTVTGWIQRSLYFLVL